MLSSLSLRSCVVALLGLASFLQVPAYAEHVHHLYYNNVQWQDEDLTTLTGGAIAGPSTAISAIYTTPNDQLHVYYVDDVVNHVHQLFFNGTNWSDTDLTTWTGGPNANPYGISAFAIKNLQYVFYVGWDSHVHELNYNNSTWVDSDITAVVGGNLATPANIVAFPTKPNNQFHVYYQDASTSNEYQLFFNGRSWAYQNLTSIAGAYCYTDWTTGIATQNLQHIICPGYGAHNSLDLHHIWYNNSTWVDEDISYKVHGAPLELGSAVGIFQVPQKAQGEVYAFTQDAHIHQYTYKKSWSDVDLTATIGAPANPYFGGMVAFATTPNNQFHIYYQPGSEIYQLFYNGSSWGVQDLTGGHGQASYFSGGMSGFAIGNYQHVFYLSTGN